MLTGRCRQAITWVTAVCGADKTGPPTTPTTPRPAEQRAETVDRQQRSDAALRSTRAPSDQRRASETSYTDRVADRDVPLLSSSSPSHRAARDKTPEYEYDSHRSESKVKQELS